MVIVSTIRLVIVLGFLIMSKAQFIVVGNCRHHAAMHTADLKFGFTAGYYTWLLASGSCLETVKAMVTQII